MNWLGFSAIKLDMFLIKENKNCTYNRKWFGEDAIDYRRFANRAGNPFDYG
jgi:hypothetical protein